MFPDFFDIANPAPPAPINPQFQPQFQPQQQFYQQPLPLQVPPQQNHFYPQPVPPQPIQPGAQAQHHPQQPYEPPPIPFQQIPGVDPSLQNHGQLREPPRQELLYDELLRQNQQLSPFQVNQERRAAMVGVPAHQRSELHSVAYKPTKKKITDPFTGREITMISDNGFEDNLLAYIRDDRLRAKYEENMFTKQQKKLLQAFQFNELKKQNVSTLHKTCLDKIVHSYAAKIIPTDVIFRIIEEHWREFKQLLSPDEIKLVSACRSSLLQLDEGVYTTSTRAETELLKLAARDSKNHYRLKRNMHSSMNSDDPLVILQNHLLLKSTSRKNVDPTVTGAQKLLEITKTPPTPSSAISMTLLNQLPKEKVGDKRKRDSET